MQSSIRRGSLWLGLILVGSLFLGSAAPAAADVEVVRSGQCTGSATWRMEVEKDDGLIDFELKVNGTQASKTWRVRIWQNDSLFYSAYRTANRYGNFEVERDRHDYSGTDTFTFRARQLSNGQVCAGTIRI